MTQTTNTLGARLTFGGPPNKRVFLPVYLDRNPVGYAKPIAGGKWRALDIGRQPLGGTYVSAYAAGMALATTGEPR